MITYEQFKNYAEWLEEVKTICNNQDTFDYYNCHYSFQSAYEAGMSAKKAFADCDRWMKE